MAAIQFHFHKFYLLTYFQIHGSKQFKWYKIMPSLPCTDVWHNCGYTLSCLLFNNIIMSSNSVFWLVPGQSINLVMSGCLWIEVFMPLRHLRHRLDLRHLRHAIYVIRVNNDLNLWNVLNNSKLRHWKMSVIPSIVDQLDSNLHRICERHPWYHTWIFVSLA